MNSIETLEIAKRLIAFDSTSSKSNEAVSNWIESFLKKIGFEVERLAYTDRAQQLKISLVARRLPIAQRVTDQPGLAYMAHTDVVPADDWLFQEHGPFEPTVKDNRLYGRGACDMKGSLACALHAVESISVQEQTSPIYFIITADEEINMLGARQVVDESSIFATMRTTGVRGIIGEPTGLQVVHAHKGTQSFRVIARGRSTHSSRSDGINANHRLIEFLPFLLEIQKESQRNPQYQNLDFEPPHLSLNLVLRNEPFAKNITPALAEATVMLRPMPGVDHQPILDRVEAQAKSMGLEFDAGFLTPPLSCEPTGDIVQSLLQLTGQAKSTTVAYGTDGCILGVLKNLCVCGPGSIDQAHCHDEWISLTQLDLGTELYQKAFHFWCCR